MSISSFKMIRYVDIPLFLRKVKKDLNTSVVFSKIYPKSV